MSRCLPHRRNFSGTSRNALIIYIRRIERGTKVELAAERLDLHLLFTRSQPPKRGHLHIIEMKKPRPEGTGARFVVNMGTAIQAEGLAGVNLALARAYKRSVYSIQYLRVEARRGGVL